MKNDKMLINILKNQVAPALGCTEPGAVAYAVARAKEILNENVLELNIEVDKNILKNGMDVGIPGTKERGIIFAAALGLVAGKSEYKLEVLKDIDKKDIDEAYKVVNSKIIKLNLKENIDGLYIEVIAKGQNNYSKVVIEKNHLNMTYEGINGKRINTINSENNNEKKHVSQKTNEEKEKNCEIKYRIKEFAIDDLIQFVDKVDYKDIEFINDGIKMNEAIAKVGINEDLGIGMGKFLKKESIDLKSKAKALTAAASEARMSGYPLPVMSSAGSGNHGLVAILPIAIIGEDKKISLDKIVRAVALSHLVTIYVKVYTGALTPVCGCGVAAGVGCAAGLTYLQGGNNTQIKGAIQNMIAGITGMICDGAKIGCSYKLAISVSSATDASEMALMGIYIPSDNGILDSNVEKTIENLGRISEEGMNNTDNVILDVMLKKCL